MVFVCHWKSKLEGEKETEAGRRAAAALLAHRIRELQTEKAFSPIVVCGDFNESPDEYTRISRRYPTAIMPSDAGTPPLRQKVSPSASPDRGRDLQILEKISPCPNENASKGNTLQSLE